MEDHAGKEENGVKGIGVWRPQTVSPVPLHTVDFYRCIDLDFSDGLYSQALMILEQCTLYIYIRRHSQFSDVSQDTNFLDVEFSPY